jgi:hypothetical protein
MDNKAATNEQKITHEKCLLCDTQGNDEAPLRRGLCTAHYTQFRNELMKKQGDDRKAFEAKAIEMGLVLPSRQGQRADISNPFRELAEELLPETDKQFLREVAKTKEAFNKPKPRKGKK